MLNSLVMKKTAVCSAVGGTDKISCKWRHGVLACFPNCKACRIDRSGGYRLGKR